MLCELVKLQFGSIILQQVTSHIVIEFQSITILCSSHKQNILSNKHSFLDMPTVDQTSCCLLYQ